MHIGVGILVATGSRPMIVTSRAIILSAICDISITIGKRNISARVLYLGLVVILTVDSSLLPPFLPIPRTSDKQYKIGDAVEVYGLNNEHQLIQRHTEIKAISALFSSEQPIPSWRITNTEAYALLDSPYTLGGALIDPSDSSIIAFWMEVSSGNSNYFAGLNYHYYIHPIVEALRNGDDVPNLYSGCILEQLHLARAIDLGMPEHHATRIDKIAKGIGTGAQAICVVEKLRHSSSELEVGDFILEIEDEPVGRMADVKRISQAEITRALVLRDRQEKDVIVRSKRLPFQGTPRIVCWAGAILQRTPNFALEQTTPEFAQVAEKEAVVDHESLVYICSCLEGSPSSGILSPVSWILEIDKQKVSSLEVLLEIIANLKGRDESEEYIRVKLIGKQGITSIVGVKLNSHFWPAWLLERKGKEWVRTELE
jgi:hypothetical protein